MLLKNYRVEKKIVILYKNYFSSCSKNIFCHIEKNKFVSREKFHLWKILYHVKRKVSQNILLVGLDWSRAIYSTYKWSKISARVINWKSLILTLTKDQFFKNFYWLLVWFCHFHQILLSFNLNEIFSKIVTQNPLLIFVTFLHKMWKI